MVTVIKNIFIPKKVINLYISHLINPWLRNLKTDFELNNCLFGSVKLTKNVDLGKYKNSGYGIGLFSLSECSFTDGSMGKNVIIFGANMSSSVHIDKRNKDILYSWWRTSTRIIWYYINSSSKISKQNILLILPIMLESLAGCCTMFPFAVSCKIGALERNA